MKANLAGLDRPNLNGPQGPRRISSPVRFGSICGCSLELGLPIQSPRKQAMSGVFATGNRIQIDLLVIAALDAGADLSWSPSFVRHLKCVIAFSGAGTAFGAV